MRNVASKLEKVLDLTMSINADLAEREAYIKEIEDRLSTLNTLKEINYYMGAELELKNILQIVTDVVMGVLGVSACAICIRKDDSWDIFERSALENYLSIVNSSVIEEIEREAEKSNGEVIIKNLSSNNFINLVEGSFIALSLLRGNVKYGVITLYYNQPDILDDNKLELFKLLSAQLAIHLENSYLFEKVKLASITDGLTGLRNRWHLNELLSKYENSDVKQSGILMIDLDNFKKVNDTYGHIVGDTVLKTLSSILAKVDKKYGIESFRYGGEEFLVICKNINIAAMADIAEEIRINFKNTSFPDRKGNPVNFSLSVGVSKYQDSSKILDMTELINLADEALYCSKASGKNSSTISSGDIQLYTRSLETLNKTIAKCKRFNSKFILCKGKIEIDEVLDKETYDYSIKNINNAFRIYDTVYYNDLGEFLAILENTDAEDMTKHSILSRLNKFNGNIVSIQTATADTIQSQISDILNIPSSLLENTLNV